MRGNELTNKIQSVYSEWEGTRMIENIDSGVRHVTINTTTCVPVLLYNKQGKVIAMSEAQRVNDLLPSTLSMLGVSPTDQSAGRQFVPQTTPHCAKK